MKSTILLPLLLSTTIAAPVVTSSSLQPRTPLPPKWCSWAFDIVNGKATNRHLECDEHGGGEGGLGFENIGNQVSSSHDGGTSNLIPAPAPAPGPDTSGPGHRRREAKGPSGIVIGSVKPTPIINEDPAPTPSVEIMRRGDWGVGNGKDDGSGVGVNNGETSGTEIGNGKVSSNTFVGNGKGTQIGNGKVTGHGEFEGGITSSGKLVAGGITSGGLAGLTGISIGVGNLKPGVTPKVVNNGIVIGS